MMRSGGIDTASADRASASVQDARLISRLAISLAAGASLLSSPAFAQDPEAPERLEDLIPDSALENPEGWAEQGVPQSATDMEDAPPEVEADSPLDAMPLVTVPWPTEIELPEIDPLDAEEDIQFAEFPFETPALVDGSEERISDELVLVFPSDLALFPLRDEFLARFKTLSTIEELDDDANNARLAAQAREDEELLQRMLAVYGYYDAQVIRSVQGLTELDPIDAPQAERGVRFDIIPGAQYLFGNIDLGSLATTSRFGDYEALRGAFEILPGDPALQDKIVEEQADLDRALGESGYPFAAIRAPELLVDHARQEADLTMIVTPQGKYRFGSVTSNRPDFLSGRHLGTIARFKPGQTYQRSEELDLRRAILATGLVASVVITPVEVQAPVDGEPGVVDMQVELVPGELRTIEGSIGYGTGEGFRAEASWQHRNLFPPEGALKVRGIAGTREQLLGVTFRKNNFYGRDRILTLDAYASTLDYDAYDARTISLTGTYEQVSTLLFQKELSWSGGFEILATQEREADANGNFGPRETYFIGALPVYALWDTSDSLLDPSEGFRLGARVSPEISKRNGGDMQTYARLQADGSYYYGVNDKIVIAGRARIASIPGAPRDEIAPSRRLYAGGGGSVRGYGYRSIGPSNSNGDPTGGRSLLEFSLEARIRTPLLDNSIGIVPFVDAGTVGVNSTPSFDEIKIGAGIGVRYYTSFGPIRVDLGVPLNPGPNDDVVGVYISLGQAF
ncbi:autotransporter assembly complex protein TamA [Paraurantiacibacter namhicola]|uniref:Translocation and assembly module TamA n=1 Tax=Paraurantiacibacter namhicola TaxID=645517 RepID=A0A1C7DAV4_9SPHN|nr:BamA/TamA family outer membrane protein [Paraurantiacibacter namhicola]ANU08578.1 Translocation and assembly module TamA precursor [Paraurantiacibacter namhicola]